MLANPSADAVYLEDCECVRDTENAILVDIPDMGENTWVPRSQVHDDSEIVN